MFIQLASSVLTLSRLAKFLLLDINNISHLLLL